MSLPDYDYQSFIADLARQAVDMLPDDLSQADRDYIVNLMISFGGDALKKIENTNGYNFDDSTLVQVLLQFICEWVYHKAIDYIRAGISKLCIESILREMCNAICEKVIFCYSNDYNLETTIKMVENYVYSICSATIKRLYDSSYITVRQRDKALVCSKWDDVVRQVKNLNWTNSMVLKLGVLSIALREASIVCANEFLEVLDGDIRAICEGYQSMPLLKDKINPKVVALYLYSMKIELFKEEETLEKLDSDKLLQELCPRLKKYDSEELKNDVIVWLSEKQDPRWKYNMWARLFRALKKRLAHKKV